MSDIPQDKAREYQQVAALLALEFDLLLEITNDTTLTKEDLIRQIKHQHKKKEKIINDAQDREEQYNAASLLFGLAAQGKIRSTPLEG